VQYGLIAEEVERVYPELVAYADGKLETVRYSMLTPMLLNELQKQTRITQELAQQLREQAASLQKKQVQLDAQQRQIDTLKQNYTRLEALSDRVAALERHSKVVDNMGRRSLASE
jgi:hypothetical protein